MCKDLFDQAARKMLDGPIRLTPRCHPKAHVDAYVDHRTWTVTLCCGKCDRPITTLNMKRHNGRTLTGDPSHTI